MRGKYLPAVVAATLLLACAAPSAGAAVLFQTDYRDGLGDWTKLQMPSGTVRLTAVADPAPATDPLRHGTPVMRAEVRSGDLTVIGPSSAERSEVYGRHARPRSTPAEQWPDPVGSVRWYEFDLYLPEDLPTATTKKQWVTLTQWKGLNGGSPPVALEIKRDWLRLGGARANAGLVPVQDLGPLPRGRWTRLRFGMKLSPDPTEGWVEVHRDGVRIVDRFAVATMDTLNGRVDPIYFKQGIYRGGGWAVDHVALFGPVRIAQQAADLDGTSAASARHRRDARRKHRRRR